MKQKTQVQWFNDWDTTLKCFHSLVRGKKRRLLIHIIINENTQWLQGNYNIATAACYHIEKIFTCDDRVINEVTLDCTPRMVSQQKNNRLTITANIEEWKEVSFSMNPTSVSGPNGINGYFFSKMFEYHQRGPVRSYPNLIQWPDDS